MNIASGPSRQSQMVEALESLEATISNICELVYEAHGLLGLSSPPSGGNKAEEVPTSLLDKRISVLNDFRGRIESAIETMNKIVAELKEY